MACSTPRPRSRFAGADGRPGAVPTGRRTRAVPSRADRGPGRTARRWIGRRTPAGRRARRRPEVRATTPSQSPHLEDLTSVERQHMTGRDRRAVDPDFGDAPTTATWDGPMPRRRAPPPVSSSAPEPGRFPTSRLASRNENRSAGPARGTPAAATPRRPPSWTTARSPGAITSRMGRSPASAPTPAPAPAPALAGAPHRHRPPSVAPGPRGPALRRGRLGREQGDAGAADELPPSRRGRGVDGGMAVGQCHRSRGHHRARAVAPGHGASGSGSPSR